LPRKTGVVPLAVEGGNRCSPVNTVEVLLTDTFVSGHFYVRQALQNPDRSPELCIYFLCGFKRIFLRFKFPEVDRPERKYHVYLIVLLFVLQLELSLYSYHHSQKQNEKRLKPWFVYR